MAVLLDLLYIWTDFPINYVAFGMLPYFLSIPLALVATGVFARFLTRGGCDQLAGARRPGEPGISGPPDHGDGHGPGGRAGLRRSHRSRWRRQSRAVGRWRGVGVPTGVRSWARTTLALAGHVAVWTIPLVVLAVNSFWWLPGIWLASTKGLSDFAFAHPEGVAQRLLQIRRRGAADPGDLAGRGRPRADAAVASRRGPGLGSVGFCAAGTVLGLPGRRACELSISCNRDGTPTPFSRRWPSPAVPGSTSCGGASRRLTRRRPSPRRVHDRCRLARDRLVEIPAHRVVAAAPLVRRALPLEPALCLASSGSSTACGATFSLASACCTRKGVKIYPGVRDPFQRGRFSGLLPERTGVEVIGGPYLHASLTTNFTQFGEGKLCGKANWDRADFVRYAKLYRPSAILCWSPHARGFCRQNPDLIRVLDEDGPVLIGRIVGFAAACIEGKATVRAESGSNSGLRDHPRT